MGPPPPPANDVASAAPATTVVVKTEPLPFVFEPAEPPSTSSVHSDAPRPSSTPSHFNLQLPPLEEQVASPANPSASVASPGRPSSRRPQHPPIGSLAFIGQATNPGASSPPPAPSKLLEKSPRNPPDKVTSAAPAPSSRRQARRADAGSPSSNQPRLHCSSPPVTLPPLVSRLPLRLAFDLPFPLRLLQFPSLSLRLQLLLHLLLLHHQHHHRQRW